MEFSRLDQAVKEQPHIASKAEVSELKIIERVVKKYSLTGDDLVKRRQLARRRQKQGKETEEDKEFLEIHPYFYMYLKIKRTGRLVQAFFFKASL